jgi:hypothetical protein
VSSCRCRAESIFVEQAVAFVELLNPERHLVFCGGGVGVGDGLFGVLAPRAVSELSAYYVQHGLVGDRAFASPGTDVAHVDHCESGTLSQHNDGPGDER